MKPIVLAIALTLCMSATNLAADRLFTVRDSIEMSHFLLRPGMVLCLGNPRSMALYACRRSRWSSYICPKGSTSCSVHWSGSLRSREALIGSASGFRDSRTRTPRRRHSTDAGRCFENWDRHKLQGNASANPSKCRAFDLNLFQPIATQMKPIGTFPYGPYVR